MSNPTSTIMVVAGLIQQPGKLLICQRRRDGAFALKWEFPGGKVEAGETCEDGLRRELHEELGESAEYYVSGLASGAFDAYADALDETVSLNALFAGGFAFEGRYKHIFEHGDAFFEQSEFRLHANEDAGIAISTDNFFDDQWKFHNLHPLRFTI